MKTIKNLIIIALFISTFIACSNNEDPIPVNEEELITTVTITLTPNGNGTPITIKSVDLDGDGPNAPVITGGTLTANTTYTGVVKVENETENPAEDITLEVLEEAEEHQFFYTITNNIATVTYDDMDGNGNPIGVQIILTTSNANTGDLTITLRHEPIKSASGVSNGDITNADGETDVQATFPIIVQ